MTTEAPDPREDEDCPGPEVCGSSCDQHSHTLTVVPGTEPVSVLGMVEALDRAIEMEHTESERALLDLPPHNHVTRDIKPPGVCPGCDQYHEEYRARAQHPPSTYRQRSDR